MVGAALAAAFARFSLRVSIHSSWSRSRSSGGTLAVAFLDGVIVADGVGRMEAFAEDDAKGLVAAT